MNRRTLLRTVGIGTVGASATGVAGASSLLSWDDDLDTNIVTLRQSSDGEESADVACGPVTVVTGTITGSPCDDVVVSDASLDAGTLRVTVETVQPDDVDVCDTSVAWHDYLATVSGYSSEPDEVVVAHEGEGVATEQCDDHLATAFQVTGPGEEIEDSADVRCGRTVLVSGTIVAPNPCYEGVLENVSKSGDKLVIDVATRPRDEDQVCNEVLTSYDYVAAVAGLVEAPDTVVVRHDDEIVTELLCDAFALSPDLSGL